MVASEDIGKQILTYGERYGLSGLVFFSDFHINLPQTARDEALFLSLLILLLRDQSCICFMHFTYRPNLVLGVLN